MNTGTTADTILKAQQMARLATLLEIAKLCETEEWELTKGMRGAARQGGSQALERLASRLARMAAETPR